MIVREHVPLRELTTFRIGGPARFVLDLASPDELPEAISFAHARQLPWYVLGEGSNVLASDAGYEGVIVRAAYAAFSFEPDADGALLVAHAGASWDEVVRAAAERNLWGIENLAGIPGTAGAAPVQNIGAYGAELSDALAWVEAYDARAKEAKRFSKEECALGYRQSRFKSDPSLVITRIALRLRSRGEPRLSYADLARAKESGAPLSTPAEVGDAVRSIRSKKFPDLSKVGTAGSFFKNPFIPEEAFAKLKARYPDLPGFPADGRVKVSLAWLLDRALSLKGCSRGAARLFEAQPLVIVAEAGATSGDVAELARTVAKKVKTEIGIEIEWEARAL